MVFSFPNGSSSIVQSLPLGNGDAAANIATLSDGRVQIYFAKADA